MIAGILLGILAAIIFVRLWSRRASFQGQDPLFYRATTPEFDITTALQGPMQAHGVIYDFRGRATSRFVARFEGAFTPEGGTIHEDFRYDTGRSQQRVWTIQAGTGGHFTATAPDIIGTARGRQAGNTVRMAYRIVLPRDLGGHALDVIDWMYLFDDGVILNKSEFRKFGFKLAELVATFRRVEA